MGLAIISTAIKEASQLYKEGERSKVMDRTAKQSIAFIQGTGLDITIRRFHLDLEPESIRSEFYRIFHDTSH